MKASLMTRLERLEKDSPIDDEASRIDKILLVSPDRSIVEELWTRPGFVEAANVS
jgi:hypothetical protein